jgi:hypothetical protein
MVGPVTMTVVISSSMMVASSRTSTPTALPRTAVGEEQAMAISAMAGQVGVSELSALGRYLE